MNEYIPWKVVVVMLLGTFTASYLVGYAVGVVEGHKQSRVVQERINNNRICIYEE